METKNNEEKSAEQIQWENIVGVPEKGEISSTRRIWLILNYFGGYFIIYPMLIMTFFFSSVVAEGTPKALAAEIEIQIQIAVCIITLLVTLLLAKPFLKNEFQKLKTKFAILIVFKNLAFSYIAQIIIGTILDFFITNQNANQSAVENIISNQLLAGFFLTVIFAPIVEEIVFRGVIFKALRRKNNFVIAALISGFIFGAIHILNEILVGDWIMIFYIFIYAAMGFFMAKTYEETDNIYCAILFHLISNAIAFTLLVIGV